MYIYIYTHVWFSAKCIRVFCGVFVGYFCERNLNSGACRKLKFSSGQVWIRISHQKRMKIVRHVASCTSGSLCQFQLKVHQPAYLPSCPQNVLSRPSGKSHGEALKDRAKAIACPNLWGRWDSSHVSASLIRTAK